MRTARLLTVSHSIPCISGGSAPRQIPPCRPPPLVMWPVMHAGKPSPPPPWTEWQMLVIILPCPKLCLWAVKNQSDIFNTMENNNGLNIVTCEQICNVRLYRTKEVIKMIPNIFVFLLILATVSAFWYLNWAKVNIHVWQWGDFVCDRTAEMHVLL